MPEEHRRKLENEAKSWLQIQTHKSALEIGAGMSILLLLPFHFINSLRSHLAVAEDGRYIIDQILSIDSLFTSL